jgi:hypothetical protein
MGSKKIRRSAVAAMAGVAVVMAILVVPGSSREKNPLTRNRALAPTTASAAAPVLAGSNRPASAGANLIQNSLLPNEATWTTAKGAQFQPDLSHDPGTGSFRLPPGAQTTSAAIPVSPGTLYTFSAYIRSGAWPPGNVTLYVAAVNADGTQIRQLLGNAHANSKLGVWEEAAITIIPEPDVQFISVHAERFNAQSGTGDMWVDDFSLTRGLVLREPPTPKTEFTGSRVRVDSRGNFDVFENGKWKPFFPFCIAADQARPSFVPLARQGFNCNVWGGSVVEVQKAKDAGMYSGIEIAQFTNTGGHSYGRADVLTSTVDALRKAGLSDSVLWYYWDNEESYAEYDTPRKIVDTIRAIDVDAAGQRMHPIFVLQGNYGMARASRTDAGVAFSDVVGTYLPGGNTGGAGGGPASTLILGRLQGQTSPESICQINSGVSVTFRSRLYGCLANGGRGLSFWADNVPGQNVPPAEQQPFWPILPSLRSEIERLLPILRSDSERWTLRSSIDNAATPISFGTRYLDKTGYVLLGNQTVTPQPITFSFDGVGYKVTRVKDLLTNRLYPVANNQLTITVEPAGLTTGAHVFELQSAKAAKADDAKTKADKKKSAKKLGPALPTPTTKKPN